MIKNKPKSPRKNAFKTVVEQNPEIRLCYQSGLQALGSDSNKVTLADTRLCDGSVFLDKCLEETYANASRWDYAVAYNGLVVFMEVHPAETNEVKVMLQKLEWLKKWLRDQAPRIEDMRDKERPFYWIASGRSNLLKGSPQYRRAAEARLLPVSQIKL